MGPPLGHLLFNRIFSASRGQRQDFFRALCRICSFYRMGVFVAFFFTTTAYPPALVLPENDKVFLVESWWYFLLLVSLRYVSRAGVLFSVAGHTKFWFFLKRWCLFLIPYTWFIHLFYNCLVSLLQEAILPIVALLFSVLKRQVLL